MRFSRWAVGAAILLLTAAQPALATTYSLSTDWSSTANPNGVWSYSASGVAGFGYQAAATPNGNPLIPATVGGYFSNGPDLNLNTPDVLRAAVNGSAAGGTDLDFVAGDIVIHTPNGGQALSIRWTAPGAGVIDFQTLVWYAHSSVDRSNDVSLLLDGNVLGTTVVSRTSHQNNTAPWTVNNSGVSVDAGDVLELVFTRSQLQTYGSLNGLSFDVNFTPGVAAVPEASTWAMVIVGFAGAGFMAHRRKAQSVTAA